MSLLDWAILSLTLAFIVGYGVWKTKGSKDIHGFLLGGKESKWWVVGLSVMATQASAITFLSTPGQAYTDGMGFVQFYFGLPLAMIVICITFIPIYYKLKVYTAYEFLEGRFDLKTRTLTSILFLVQRGLAAGITIYAPAIILSTLMDWNLTMTNVVIGTLVIIYTMSGGTRAVSQTQKHQMVIILTGMIVALIFLIRGIPSEYSFTDAMNLANHSGRLDTLDFSFDLNNRYTIWSGIIGGFFLALSYFGTDQSQVQRYLSARSMRESQMGLIFNAFLKIPMQLFILFVGVMVFIFYQFNQAPVFFNSASLEKIEQSSYAPRLIEQQQEYDLVYQDRLVKIDILLDQNASIEKRQDAGMAIDHLNILEQDIRDSTKRIIHQFDPGIETNDKDYVFITYILENLPKGIIGLLLAVIFSAAMSSTASELNALASTTTVDLYKRSYRSNESDMHYVKASQGFTLMWGVIAILFASFGTLFENLIQYVNIIGSIFYGTILGIFLVAFYIKKVKGNAVFISALIAETVVITAYNTTSIGYLWYNLIGCFLVIILSLIIQSFWPKSKKSQ